ncbi:tRNA (cytidine(34)-2'-O)-methyltransferase [Parvularcula sp. IMCC14364]|uniref:tRNA (cytidine(34)-2'-O)-methyltransferase n=1 Tax=Parvularcula sp. IMCC14364 TaxID=3067902 RepID=UPI0027428757|nr:TrmH family RNA methyltransferase [Parvularcula sp. IMCC14364]
MNLAFYQPEIAQNVGAAIRLAACFDITLHIIEPCGFPLKDRDIRKVAMDYGALAAPTYHASWEAFATSEVRQQSRLILLSTKASTSLYDIEFLPSDTLLMGQESAGVPDTVRDSCDLSAIIPLAPQARSLNVSVAAGIAVSEAMRKMRSY